METTFVLSFVSFSTSFNKGSNNKACGENSLVRIRTRWFGERERERDNKKTFDIWKIMFFFIAYLSTVRHHQRANADMCFFAKDKSDFIILMENLTGRWKDVERKAEKFMDRSCGLEMFLVHFFLADFGFLCLFFQEFLIPKDVNKQNSLLTKAGRGWQQRTICLFLFSSTLFQLSAVCGSDGRTSLRTYSTFDKITL